MPVAPPATDERPPSTDRLPTLTEVVELGGNAVPAFGDFDAGEAGPAAQPPRDSVPADATAASPATEFDRAALVEQVLQDLTPQIDLLFEARVREAMAPALARAADGLIRQTREELATVLRGLVQEAVARSLERRE
jgi:hypothetical protein